MRKLLLLLGLALILSTSASAFCGFYVASAGAKIYNKASQVILVRDGNRTVVTMNNDFQGEVKDFAMVVPVPVILRRNQIRISEQSLFDSLDQYSGPRLVEYYDDGPCRRDQYVEDASASDPSVEEMGVYEPQPPVRIEAQYTVGEYDIKILSADRSTDLENWLRTFDYHVPEGAWKVLQPYVQSDMKFFVVKIDVEKFYELNPSQRNMEFPMLRPLQIEYNSPKFMLPIRLGMANSKDYQDLTIYSFTRNGRIETANYPTKKLPTAEEVPMWVKDSFPSFYKAVFDKAWQDAGKRSVMLEYAWDISGSNYMMCDPCTGDPPTLTMLLKAGVNWVKPAQNQPYDGEVYFTRLHARYTEALYPEDFQFQITPNKENYQARYIIRHPATRHLDCPEGITYARDFNTGAEARDENLIRLTGWKSEDVPKAKRLSVPAVAAGVPVLWIAGIGVVLGVIGTLLFLRIRGRGRRQS